MITLKDVKRKSGPQPGGSINLYLIPWSDVLSIPVKNPLSKKIEGDIICKLGKKFVKYEFAPGKCKLSCSSTGSDGSAYFRTTISVTIPGDDAELLSIFSDMINGHFIAILDQATKAVKLAGSMAIPLTCMQVDYDAGGEQGDSNGTVFQFENKGFMVEDYVGVIPLTPTDDLSTSWSGMESSAYCETGGDPVYSYTPTTGNLLNSANGGDFEGAIVDWHLSPFSAISQIAEEITIKQEGGKSCKITFNNTAAYARVRTDIGGGYFENSEYAGIPTHTKTSAWIYIPSVNPGLKEDDYISIDLAGYKSEFKNAALVHGNLYYIKDLPKDQWFQIQKVIYHTGDVIPGEVPYITINFYGKDNTPFNDGGVIYIDTMGIFEVDINLVEPNTGYKAWLTLEEHFVATGIATGNTKPNDPEDPDFVAPVYDPISCPLP